MFLTTDDGNIGDNVTQALEDGWRTWTGFGLALAIAVGVALAVMVVVSIALSLIGRRGRWAAELHARTRWPFRTTLLVIALLIASIALPVGRPRASPHRGGLRLRIMTLNRGMGGIDAGRTPADARHSRPSYRPMIMARRLLGTISAISTCTARKPTTAAMAKKWT